MKEQMIKVLEQKITNTKDKNLKQSLEHKLAVVKGNKTVLK